LVLPRKFKMNEETENKIKEMQLIDQNLQHVLMQKQSFQTQLLELDSALEEIETTSEQYKIVGSIMVKSEKEALKKDLKSKKEIFELRLKNLDKQEIQFKENASHLQNELLQELKLNK